MGYECFINILITRETKAGVCASYINHSAMDLRRSALLLGSVWGMISKNAPVPSLGHTWLMDCSKIAHCNFCWRISV